MEGRRTSLYFMTLLGVLVAMIWPALWNRAPFYFPDTRTYIRSVDTPVNNLTGPAPSGQRRTNLKQQHQLCHRMRQPPLIITTSIP
jgi:hypothetical protein